MAHFRSSMFMVLIGMTASSMGMCLNGNRSTTANEYLISKWKMRYEALDVNHDGKVSTEDVEELENKFTDLEHLDAQNLKVAKAVFTQFWDECVFLVRKGEIFEHEFVESYKTGFNANTEEFVKERRRCLELIFSAIDVNEDKSISKEELQIAHTAFGHPQLAKDNVYFSAYNPKNGLVPFHIIVDDWVDFVTNTDESKDNVIKNGFDVDGFK